MNSLFLYGTLCVPEVFELVTGQYFSSLLIEQVYVDGLQAYYVMNEDYPGVKKSSKGSFLEGLRVLISDETLWKLWIYEGRSDYELIEVSTIDKEGQRKAASLFFPKSSLELSGKVWSLKQWLENSDLDHYLDQVRIWMSQDTL